MLTTIWASLKEFIDTRDPAFWGSVRAVPSEDIAACEEGCALSFPKIYVDFLSAMGAASGDLRPFGGHQACNFYDLVTDLPAESYPGDRYFKVSFDDDASKVVRQDTFIDFAGSNGEDAPLVRFEDGGDFSEENVTSLGFPLSGQFSRRVFDFFEVRRRPERSVLRIYPDTGEALVPQRQILLNLLAKMGLEPVWPPQPQVACVRDDALSVLVELTAQTQGIAVKIGASSRRTLRVAAERIRDRFPEAMTDDR